MKCLIKNLLGLDLSASNNSGLCTPLPPLVQSLFGSVFFITLMTIASHMLKSF